MKHLFEKYLAQVTTTLVDPIGVKYLPHILGDRFAEETLAHPSYTLHEEVFEWLELLESVDKAEDKFVFVELGAGYGRWCARAFKACLSRRISLDNIRLICVEGEPQHARWLTEHLAYNDIPSKNIHMKEALVSNYNGKGEMIVHFQDGLNGMQTPKNWYGQSHVPAAKKEDIWIMDTYLGKDLIIDRNGIGRVVCDTITLESLLIEENCVDLLNMDIQGSEFLVIRDSLDLLNKKVKKVYISTHSPQIDEALFQIMKNNNWTNTYSYPFQQKSQTEFGEIQFGDGIQIWENPLYRQ